MQFLYMIYHLSELPIPETQEIIYKNDDLQNFYQVTTALTLNQTG